MVDLPAEDFKEKVEAAVETQTFQGDNWKAAHATGLTANRQTAVETMGQHSESNVIAASGGGRATSADTIPKALQTFDGQTLAMQNFKNPYAPAMLDNRVVQADDQRENRARADAQLLAEIKDRAPVTAFAAQGALTALTAMVAGLGTGPVGVQPGGPMVTNGAGSSAPQMDNKGPKLSA